MGVLLTILLFPFGGYSYNKSEPQTDQSQTPQLVPMKAIPGSMVGTYNFSKDPFETGACAKAINLSLEKDNASGDWYLMSRNVNSADDTGLLGGLLGINLTHGSTFYWNENRAKMEISPTFASFINDDDHEVFEIVLKKSTYKLKAKGPFSKKTEWVHAGDELTAISFVEATGALVMSNTGENLGRECWFDKKP